MHIAYLSNSRFPSERAHSTQIVQNCAAFSSEGHEVSLVVTNRPTKILQTWIEYYRVSGSFKILRIKVPDMATNVMNVPRFLRSSSYNFQRLVFALRSAVHVKVKQADVIYSRDEWVLWVVSFFRGYDCLVYESHEAKYSYAVRQLAKHGIPIVVISEGIRSEYIAQGIKSQQILVAHDGIDQSFLETVETKQQARNRLGLDQNTLIAMYIGGFDTWKGIETFFAASHASNEKIQFVAIGGNNQQIEQYQKTYPDVIFLGPLPYHTLKDNQQAADVLVIPNTAKNDVSAKYTSPLKAFAFMASGVPIVVSDIPSLKSIFGDDLATYAKADDPVSFFQAIKKVLIDHSAQAQSQAALTRAKIINYTWENRAKKIVHFIQKS